MLSVLDFKVSKGVGRKKARDLLFAIQDGLCCYCGKQCHQNNVVKTVEEKHAWFVLDHKISTADGGSDMFSNLVGSCWICNARKGRSSFKD